MAEWFYPVELVVDYWDNTAFSGRLDPIPVADYGDFRKKQICLEITSPFPLFGEFMRALIRFLYPAKYIFERCGYNLETIKDMGPVPGTGSTMWTRIATLACNPKLDFPYRNVQYVDCQEESRLNSRLTVTPDFDPAELMDSFGMAKLLDLAFNMVYPCVAAQKIELKINEQDIEYGWNSLMYYLDGFEFTVSLSDAIKNIRDEYKNYSLPEGTPIIPNFPTPGYKWPEFFDVNIVVEETPSVTTNEDSSGKLVTSQWTPIAKIWNGNGYDVTYKERETGNTKTISISKAESAFAPVYHVDWRNCKDPYINLSELCKED